MSSTTQSARTEVIDGFLAGLPRLNVGPLWKVLSAQLAVVPESGAVPYLWRWQELRPQLLRAGELVSAGEAERRVLMLLNPGLQGRVATTHTLFAGLQLILPGEVARTHRHTQNALRFIIEGSGGYTVVDGEKLIMEPGDFVLTPNWTWHEHGSEGQEPVVWLDGLDLPLAGLLAGTFFEPYHTESQALAKTVDESVSLFGTAGLLPAVRQSSLGQSPLLKYPWSEARPALLRLPDDADSPADGAMLQYVNPASGGSSLTTIASFLQRLRPGQCTQAHRHSASAVYLAVEGRGRTVIDGRPYDWTPGDVFALPTWAIHHHENRSASQTAILFSFTDAPIMKSLGWYREQAVPAADGG